jgi:hypothetical protein
MLLGLACTGWAVLFELACVNRPVLIAWFELPGLNCWSELPGLG